MGNAHCVQRGPGHLAVPRWGPDFEPDNHHREVRTKSDDKPSTNGVYVSQHLSLLEDGQVSDLPAKVRTGLGKSDRPGS